MRVYADYVDNEKIIFGNTAVSGAELEYGLLGDVNSDNSLTISDVTMILQKISGYVFGGKYNGRVADFNGDGDVNIMNCLNMLKAIANWTEVTIADGVSEDFQVYCDLGISLEIIIQEGISKLTMSAYLSVIKDVSALDSYVSTVKDMYKMGDTDTTYSETSLKDKYTEDFFAENDLVIIDADSPLYYPESFSHCIITEKTDTGIQIVFLNSFNPIAPMDYGAHYLFTVPKSLNVNADNIELINRYTTTPTFDGLNEYTEKDAFVEVKAH